MVNVKAIRRIQTVVSHHETGIARSLDRRPQWR
jgi:hypothetical protein